MSELTLASVGISTNAELMSNGERRFRFLMPDDSVYIRTESGHEGAWQNAHLHRGVRETYIVQSGWIAFAIDEGGGLFDMKILSAGEVVSSEPGIPHNVFMSKDAVIHTVKHGVAVGNPEKNGADWFPASEKFDTWTKTHDIAMIAAHTGKSYAMLAC